MLKRLYFVDFVVVVVVVDDDVVVDSLWWVGKVIGDGGYRCVVKMLAVGCVMELWLLGDSNHNSQQPF